MWLGTLKHWCSSCSDVCQLRGRVTVSLSHTYWQNTSVDGTLLLRTDYQVHSGQEECHSRADQPSGSSDSVRMVLFDALICERSLGIWDRLMVDIWYFEQETFHHLVFLLHSPFGLKEGHHSSVHEVPLTYTHSFLSPWSVEYSTECFIL